MVSLRATAGCLAWSSVWVLRGIVQPTQPELQNSSSGARPDFALICWIKHILVLIFWASPCLHLRAHNMITVFFLYRVVWPWPTIPPQLFRMGKGVGCNWVTWKWQEPVLTLGCFILIFKRQLVAVSVSGALTLWFPVTPYWWGSFFQVLPSCL